jgi:hypothetical protein
MLTRRSASLGILSATASLALPSSRTFGADNETDGFNGYIVQAIDQLMVEYAHKGYNKNCVYTHDMTYGNGVIHATKPPLSMCVAATAEVIITAINLFMSSKEPLSSTNIDPINYLTAVGWSRMSPIDIKAHIWVDPRLDSYGTADALVTFGIGKRVPFSALSPGSFVNINRHRPDRKPTGHSVVFLSYLDQHGVESLIYNSDIVGFKYWSCNQSAPSGFGYRYAFFNDENNEERCPHLNHGYPVDCGVIFSRSQKLLNTGYLLLPQYWDASIRVSNLKALK